MRERLSVDSRADEDNEWWLEEGMTSAQIARELGQGRVRRIIRSAEYYKVRGARRASGRAGARRARPSERRSREGRARNMREGYAHIMHDYGDYEYDTEARDWMRGEQLREEMESGVAFEETNNMGAEDARSVFTQHAPVSEETAAWLDRRRRRGWADERKVAANSASERA